MRELIQMRDDIEGQVREVHPSTWGPTLLFGVTGTRQGNGDTRPGRASINGCRNALGGATARRAPGAPIANRTALYMPILLRTGLYCYVQAYTAL